MRKTFALVLSGLSLALAQPSWAELVSKETAPACEVIEEPIPIELKGRLTFYTIYPESPFARPIREWQLVVGDKSYGLDFGGKQDLLTLADKFENNTVVVTGELRGNTVRVRELKADNYVARTVRVTVKGKLRTAPMQMLPAIDPVPLRFYVLEVVAGGRAYELSFPGKADLRLLAEKNLDKTVEITGAVRHGVLSVDGLKPVETEQIDETTTVEIKGQLDSFLAVPDLSQPQKTVELWYVSVDGKVYQLDFRSRSQVRLAQKLKGQTVIATGTLKNGLVSLTDLRAA